MTETYLGDGVYASFDGFHIWLDLRGQDNTTKIALDPKVFDALVKFHVVSQNARVESEKG